MDRCYHVAAANPFPKRDPGGVRCGDASVFEPAADMGELMMTTPVVREDVEKATCPTCGEPMRREFDWVRNPPMPGVFWFCTNADCADGKGNRIYSGG